ncbi:MAG: adenosylmethionine decarboxylase [Bdellovibrionales bacterium]|nr:adenosylmethionine decarboxylase [Bdellovibrionales bacterium]
MEEKIEFGKHYIVELIDCDPELLKKTEQVKDRFIQAAEISNATIIDTKFKQFNPTGVSGLILIAESHFTIHTWPESGYAGVDIFTCGEQMDPELAVETLVKSFKAKRHHVKVITRGIPA